MSYTVILPTIYGQMLVNRNDCNQYRYLLKDGKAIDDEEIRTLTKFIRPGTNAVDVGTCFGAWTLEFAKYATKVYAFEPQRIVHNQLCGSLALNDIENVYLYGILLGSQRGLVEVPNYDYSKPLQVGAVCFCGPHNLQPDTPPSTEYVQCCLLDDFNLSNVSVIKIDAEGMDLEVLYGARQTIARNRPVLFVEVMFLEKQKVADFMDEIGYQALDASAMNAIAFPKELYDAERKDEVLRVTWKGEWPIQEG